MSITIHKNEFATGRLDEFRVEEDGKVDTGSCGIHDAIHAVAAYFGYELDCPQVYKDGEKVR